MSDRGRSAEGMNAASRLLGLFRGRGEGPDVDDAAPSSGAALTPGWLSGRTLVLNRWIAVLGQAVAILIVYFGLGFDLPIVPALAVVGISAVVNLVVAWRRPMAAPLRNVEATLYLAYDMLQLSALLYLTGGLQNPFSLLILAPVIVSATVLSRSSTVGLGILAGLCITVLALAHLPFPWKGDGLRLPDIYVLGIWEALAFSTVFIAAYVGSVAEEARRMANALAETGLALAREQRLSALGGLAAAAAHELGSPLGTIAVTLKEIERELDDDSPLKADIRLLLEESARCREILARLSRHPEAEGDDPFARLPVSGLVEMAATPHRSPDRDFVFDSAPAAESGEEAPEPEMPRRPEILHGLGNLAQNAVQFARQEVLVRTRWDRRSVSVEILDDGPGLDPGVLQRIGEPYISHRAGGGEAREGGAHMGLGIFIAKHLLERTGATVRFANRPEGGACVTVRWDRAAIETA